MILPAITSPIPGRAIRLLACAVFIFNLLSREDSNKPPSFEFISEVLGK